MFMLKCPFEMMKTQPDFSFLLFQRISIHWTRMKLRLGGLNLVKSCASIVSRGWRSHLSGSSFHRQAMRTWWNKQMNLFTLLKLVYLHWGVLQWRKSAASHMQSVRWRTYTHLWREKLPASFKWTLMSLLHRQRMMMRSAENLMSLFIF